MINIEFIIKNPSKQFFLNFLHDLLVFAWASIWYEGKTASSSMVEGDANAPQIHRHTISFLLRFPQYCTLIHVRMLKHTSSADEELLYLRQEPQQTPDVISDMMCCIFCEENKTISG